MHYCTTTIFLLCLISVRFTNIVENILFITLFFCHAFTTQIEHKPYCEPRLHQQLSTLLTISKFIQIKYNRLHQNRQLLAITELLCLFLVLFGLWTFNNSRRFPTLLFKPVPGQGLHVLCDSSCFVVKITYWAFGESNTELNKWNQSWGNGCMRRMCGSISCTVDFH